MTEQTTIQTRADSIDETTMNAFANSEGFLRNFEGEIALYGIEELQDINAKINSGMESSKRKVSMLTWHLGQPISIKVHEQLCNYSKTVENSEWDEVESVNTEGVITIRRFNPQGLNHLSPNTDETVLRLMQISHVPKALTAGYAKAALEIEKSNSEYVVASANGSDAELGRAQRAKLTAMSNMTQIRAKIANSSNAVTAGKDFAVSMLKGTKLLTQSRRLHQQSRIKIMSAQTTSIRERIAYLQSEEHLKVTLRVSDQYGLNRAAAHFEELGE